MATSIPAKSSSCFRWWALLFAVHGWWLWPTRSTLDLGLLVLTLPKRPSFQKVRKCRVAVEVSYAGSIGQKLGLLVLQYGLRSWFWTWSTHLEQITGRDFCIFLGGKSYSEKEPGIWLAYLLLLDAMRWNTHWVSPPVSTRLSSNVWDAAWQVASLQCRQSCLPSHLFPHNSGSKKMICLHIGTKMHIIYYYNYNIWYIYFYTQQHVYTIYSMYVYANIHICRRLQYTRNASESTSVPVWNWAQVLGAVGFVYSIASGIMRPSWIGRFWVLPQWEWWSLRPALCKYGNIGSYLLCLRCLFCETTSRVPAAVLDQDPCRSSSMVLGWSQQHSQGVSEFQPCASTV